MTRLSMSRIPSSERMGGATRRGGRYDANILADLAILPALMRWLHGVFPLAQTPLFCEEGM
jgi:hypothetical protein